MSGQPLSHAALIHIYMMLSPHGTDRKNMVAAVPQILGFERRFMSGCANRIEEWWVAMRSLHAPIMHNDPNHPLQRTDVSAYPRSFILREICSNLDQNLIRLFPEFLTMVQLSGRYHVSQRERQAVRDMKRQAPHSISSRVPSKILGGMATDPRLSNRIIANAAMLAARVGRLRFDG